MDSEYFIIRPLNPTPTVYQKQKKEEKLNQYIFDDKLHSYLVFERFNIKHDGRYSPVDADDFKRGDFWFCTYDKSNISQENYDKMKSIYPLDIWYEWANEHPSYRNGIVCKIQYFFKSILYKLKRGNT